MAKKIRIGDTFTRTYRFWNPVPGTRQPDYANPRNLSGEVISFCMANGERTLKFSGSRVVVSGGTVTVTLLPADTRAFKPEEESTSYLLFVKNNVVTTKAVRKEKIVEQETV